MSLFSKGKQILSDEGFLALLKRSSAFLKKSIYLYNNSYYLFEERLDDDVSVPPCSLDNLSIKPLFFPTMTQLEYEGFGDESFDFPSHPDAQEYVPRCREAPDMGMLVLYATVNGEFVHRNAFVLNGKGTLYERLEGKIRPPFYSVDDKRTAYRALNVTNHKYRGKGVYKHIMAETHNFMRKEGFSKLVYTEDLGRIYLMKTLDEIDAEVKLRLYQITLFSRFKFLLVRPCRKPPLVELGIPH